MLGELKKYPCQSNAWLVQDCGAGIAPVEICPGFEIPQEWTLKSQIGVWHF
jgi:hypothetical protein